MHCCHCHKYICTHMHTQTHITCTHYSMCTLHIIITIYNIIKHIVLHKKLAVNWSHEELCSFGNLRNTNPETDCSIHSYMTYPLLCWYMFQFLRPVTDGTFWPQQCKGHLQHILAPSLKSIAPEMADTVRLFRDFHKVQTRNFFEI